MKLPNGQCSFEQNRLKHVDWFNKMILEQNERLSLLPDPIETEEEDGSYENFERKLLEDHDTKERLPTGTTTFEDWSYDNNLISYEELLKRKNNKL